MNEENSITFVTAFMKIYDNYDFDNRDLEWRLSRFKVLADMDIQICIFVCDNFYDLIRNYLKDYQNIKIMAPLRLEDLWCHTVCKKVSYSYPEFRRPDKDTYNYMLLMNSKIEFMKKAIDINPYKSSHFSWIDFNITYIFKNISLIKSFIQHVNNSNYIKDGLYIPGCWNNYDDSSLDIFLQRINWRFCGGFFIGDICSINHFWDIYVKEFPIFMNLYNKMVWEVNFWAYLEKQNLWNPIHYNADHDDSIITNLPSEVFVSSIYSKNSMCIVYKYDSMENYNQTSSCYLKYKNKDLLNVRYVNYSLDQNGYYYYRDGSSIIKNENYCYTLEMDVVPTLNYGLCMNKESVDLKSYPQFSQGLEDLRLYEHGGKLRFVATTIEYYSTGGSRMVIGDYDEENYIYNNAKIIESPYGNWFEKNWAPINDVEKELFIYSWNPLEIGEIVDCDLKIIVKHRTEHIPFLNRAKGSTIFTKHNDGYIGLVHYSEECSPRKYYHILVILDNTFYPIEMSKPFVFIKHSVEFCIGMIINESDYIFFISQMDRSPLSMCINKSDVILNKIDPFVI